MVVKDRAPIWAIISVIILVLVIVSVVLSLLISRGREGIVVIALPGFPFESMIIGLAIGLLVLSLKRRST